MQKKYIVRLTDEEREHLESLLARGRCLASRRKRASILLKADVKGPNWPDARIAEACDSCIASVENIRKRFVLEGFEAALHTKPRATPPVARKLDGRAEAHLRALACGDPPAGRSRWTLELLADKLVRLNLVESVSGQTVRRTLKKIRSSPTYAGTG